MYNNKGITQLGSVSLLLLALSACSSNKTIPSADIEAGTPVKTAKAPTIGERQAWKAKKLSERKAQLAAIKSRQLAERKKQIAIINAKRRQQQSVSTQSTAGLRNTGRSQQLTGDFSGNQGARNFIEKMVSRHGFDRGNMNYVLSKAKATSFLKRMAYADAHPSKKSKKGIRKGSWARYRGNFLTSRTIRKGLAFWNKNRSALARAEQRYGVPQEYILGIIGVETRYGDNVGRNRTIDALSTMGFENSRRGKYFTSELESYLLMARRAGLDPLQPMASYAGAIGLCQFMPSNVKLYGVDHDGSGSCNLWTPADAIGSVANYFKKHGWRTGAPVTVQANANNSKYKSLNWGYKTKYSLSHLRNHGVTPAIGNIDNRVSLIRLSGNAGEEVWLGGHNFYVITRYNHSSKYAMAVHQLAQALKQQHYGGLASR